MVGAFVEKKTTVDDDAPDLGPWPLNNNNSMRVSEASSSLEGSRAVGRNTHKNNVQKWWMPIAIHEEKHYVKKCKNSVWLLT